MGNVLVFGVVSWFQCRCQSGFIAQVSKFVSVSGFNVSSKAVSVLAKWPSFKLGFKVGLAFLALGGAAGSQMSISVNTGGLSHQHKNGHCYYSC